MRGVALLSLLVCTLAPLPPAHAQPACDEQSARLVARMYVLSNPLYIEPRALEELLAWNAPAFTEDGAATRCMRALGAALSGATIEVADLEPFDFTEQFSGWMPADLEELPTELDKHLNAMTSEAGIIGQELLWLAEAVPPATRREYDPLLSPRTPHRQALVELTPLVAIMCQLDMYWCHVFLARLRENGPLLEAQLLALARNVH